MTPGERVDELLGGHVVTSNGYVRFMGIDGDGFSVFIKGLTANENAHDHALAELRERLEVASCQVAVALGTLSVVVDDGGLSERDCRHLHAQIRSVAATLKTSLPRPALKARRQ